MSSYHIKKSSQRNISKRDLPKVVGLHQGQSPQYFENFKTLYLDLHPTHNILDGIERHDTDHTDDILGRVDEFFGILFHNILDYGGRADDIVHMYIHIPGSPFPIVFTPSDPNSRTLHSMIEGHGLNELLSSLLEVIQSNDDLMFDETARIQIYLYQDVK